MSTFIPDLTGLDWNYYVTTYQRAIFREAQKLLFDIPVYQNERLEVIHLGTTNEILVAGVDWVVNDSDIDWDAISVCKSIDSNFNLTLLKSITIIRPLVEEYRIQIKFNQLFADQVNYAAINKDRELEVTPTLIGNILEQVNYLQQMVLNPSGLYSPQSTHIKILDENPAGDNPDNTIEDELHDIDTLNGVKFIRPIYGAFFKDSVSIKNSLSGEELIVETDFRILELDYPKTRNTSNTSGVFHTIEIIKSFVGELKISYQAYGGTADVASIRKLHDRLWSLEDYLSKTSYITPNSLPADPSIIALRNKLQEIEGQMRLLLQNGLPNYGDASTGTAVLKKVTAPDDLVHYWTIGTLYRVTGSSDNVLADVFKFRLKSLLTGMMFECSVSVNVSGTGKRLMITCDNSNLPNDTFNRLNPRLRILESTIGGVYSGVVLQLGMKLGAGVLQETFAIEDMSGRESCWKLVEFDVNSTPPEDTGVLMPNGLAVWAADDINCKKDEMTIPFNDGLVFTSVNANIPLLDFQSVFEIDQISQSLNNFDFSSVKSIRHLIKVNIDNNPYDISVVTPLISWNPNSKEWISECTFDIHATRYNLKVTIKNNDSISSAEYVLTFISGVDDKTFNVIESRLMF